MRRATPPVSTVRTKLISAFRSTSGASRSFTTRTIRPVPLWKGATSACRLILMRARGCEKRAKTRPVISAMARRLTKDSTTIRRFAGTLPGMTFP